MQVLRLDSLLYVVWEKHHRNGDKKIDYGRSFAFSQRRGVLSHLAEQGDEAVIAAFLLSSGQVEDVKTNTSQTTLSYAARSRSQALVTLLLAAGAEVDAKDNSGRTLLSWAAAYGETAVKLLLAARAEVDARDDDGQTPLSQAPAQLLRESVQTQFSQLPH